MAFLFCVVCGRGSNRATWNNTITVGSNTYVACDFHDQSEINFAVANVTVPNPNVVEQDPSVDDSVQD